MNSSLFRSDEEFILIYNRNFKNVYQVCFLILKNKHDAEDITQNVFTKLYQTNIIFNDLNHEKGWLILTAKNMCINSIKYWKSRMTDLLNINEPSYTFKKDETLECLLKLKNKYKLVIYMYYYLGFKTKEISLILNVKESTVRSDLLRGRQNLKKILEDNE